MLLYKLSDGVGRGGISSSEFSAARACGGKQGCGYMSVFSLSWVPRTVTALRLGTLQPRQVFAGRVVVSSNDVRDSWHTMQLTAATGYPTTSKPCAVCMYVLEEASKYII